jgi:hypothetical protein
MKEERRVKLLEREKNQCWVMLEYSSINPVDWRARRYPDQLSFCTLQPANIRSSFGIKEGNVINPLRVCPSYVTI